MHAIDIKKVYFNFLYIDDACILSRPPITSEVIGGLDIMHNIYITIIFFKDI